MRKLGLVLILVLAACLEASTLIAVADTGFTTATTWALVDPSSYIDSELGTVVIGVANIDSPTFAPGAVTVDGVAVKVSSRAAAPAANTITITLRDSTGAANVDAVTINVSDINNVTPGGWYFVKFGSSHLLTGAGNLYLIRCVASAAAMVTLSRSTAGANNFSKMLRETATQAPVAGDQFHVLGEWTAAATVTARTVTMDETATTSYGPTVSGGPPQGATIGKSGTLDWATGANTKLYLKGVLYVYSGGTMNIGTVGTPINGANTAEYQMTSVATADSGLIVGGTLNVYGATKNNVATVLTANLAGGGTVLTLGSTAGWAGGDVLGIASTTQTAAQCESATILTVDSPTQVTLTAGVANAHSGTSPTQAEVVNLTQNVKIHGSAANLFGFIFVPLGAVEIHYAEVYWYGNTTAGKRGLEITSTAGINVGYTAFHANSALDGYAIYANTAARNLAFDHVVMFDVRRFTEIAGTAVTWTMANSVLMLQTATSNLSGVGSLTNVAFVGAAGTLANLNSPLTFNNVTWHSNAAGLEITAGASGWTVNTASAWRHPSATVLPFRFSGNGVTAYLNDVTAFGNNTSSMTIEGDRVNLYIDGLISNGDSSFATTSGVLVNALGPTFISIVDSDFSSAAGIKTAHTNDVQFTGTTRTAQVMSWNTKFNGTNVTSGIPASGFNIGSLKSGLYSQRQGTTPGDHRRYLTMGNALTNTVTFRTASPSEEVIPSSASVKMESGPKQAAVASGNTVTWSVWVYKSVGYAGSQPRLILRANPSIGVATDTVLDTMAGGAGAWEELTGVTPAAAGDAGVFEAFVDCDTSGSIYVDDWSANGTLISENRGWWQGTPMVVAGGQPIGGDTYWWTGTPAIGFPPSAPAGGATPVINNPILISRRETVGRP